MDGKVRINVYYTTGTIASCLLHPLKGKTQLFRRNQTIGSLQMIFANPRTHTGEGYYVAKDHCDDALRWRYVQAATNFCNSRQASQIAVICELWNQIRYSRGPSEMGIYNSMSEEEKSQITPLCPDGCGNCGHERGGTFCALGSILIEVARMEKSSAKINQIIPSLELISSGDAPTKPISCDDIVACMCDEGIEVKHSLSALLIRFKRQLISFPKAIRQELVYFFVKKIMHSYELLLHTKEKLENSFYTTEHMGEKINLTLYKDAFLSNDVLSAHHDYGDLTYGDEDMGGRCSCHGIRVAA